MPDPFFRDAKGREREFPPTGGPVADTHCHLGMLGSPSLALAQCGYHRVDLLCCVTDPTEDVLAYGHLDSWMDEAGVMLDSWLGSDSLSAHGGIALPEVVLMSGVHPHNAREWAPRMRAELEHLLDDDRTVGLGEVGLDYHYDFSPREDQRAVFEEQARIAVERNIPLSLHLREAHPDARRILEQTGVPDAGCILHCCMLGPEEIRPFLDMGCTIAWGGAITFAGSDEARASVPLVPLDRIITETDAPYMAPKPLRGVECTPAHVIFTADYLADLIVGAYADGAGKTDVGRCPGGDGPQRMEGGPVAADHGHDNRLTRFDVLDAIHGNAVNLLGRNRA